MIPKECKRLAEVDFPIAEVSRHSAREKSIRHGHPSTLHLWWARRPLASCRAILMALLMPDPCDLHCPDEFKNKARKILVDHPNHPRGWSAMINSDEGLRKVILEFIANFANWDHSSDADYLKTGQDLVRAAHPDESPLVVDPFAGGGSIPLEALRLGCEAFASDLNPVACLILKAMLEDIPRHGLELAEKLKQMGAELKEFADNELLDYYPIDPDEREPISYIWARTIQCESPNCGAEIPLIRSLWLCKKPKKRIALRLEAIKQKENKPSIKFTIFEPTEDNQVSQGTVSQARAKCLCCGSVLPPDRLRAQLNEQNGGSQIIFDNKGRRISGARIIAVVLVNSGKKKRYYRLPNEFDYKAIFKVKDAINEIIPLKLSDGTSVIPDETFHDIRPSPNARGLSAVTRYGINSFKQLYLDRQLLFLVSISKKIRRLNKSKKLSSIERSALDLIGLTLSRVADYCSTQSRWDSTQERNVNSFGRQALPMLWDFAELVPFRYGVGSWDSMLSGIIRVVEKFHIINVKATVQCADAKEHPLPDKSASMWFTDPPYYDSIPYADLSDFFYVWLKRIFPNEPLLRNRYENESLLTPKLRECVWNRAYKVNGREKDPQFFENCVESAFIEARRLIHNYGIGCVVFAHKSTEGWEALLTGLTKGGWVVKSSWPIATEQTQRLVARETAALATSVHLVCRARSDDAPVGDWADVLRELPLRVGDWMERLQGEGIRGADLVFACIGPALEIYSRYSRVEDPSGKEIPLGGDPEASDPHLRGYLAYVWETVGRIALEQVLGTEEAKARNSAAGALEEDARLTALFLWTLQSTNGNQDTDKNNKATASKSKSKGYSLIFDVVRRFAQPLGINLPKWENRIIETKKGIVRLLPVSERSKQLFGQEDARAVAYALEREPKTDPQLLLFPDLEEERVPKVRGRGRRQSKKGIVVDSSFEESPEATTLDRVHAAMLLQSGGQANALRAMIKSEQERGPDFLRLANALSALYPKGNEEKRLVDAMLLAVPR